MVTVHLRLHFETSLVARGLGATCEQDVPRASRADRESFVIVDCDSLIIAS